MGDRRFVILILFVVGVFGVLGVYQYSNAEISDNFVCTPNSQNGHVNCSSPPIVGNQGLFLLNSENSCPIEVTFVLENKFVVIFGDSQDCIYEDGFTLALTLDN